MLLTRRVRRSTCDRYQCARNYAVQGKGSERSARQIVLGKPRARTVTADHTATPSIVVEYKLCELAIRMHHKKLDCAKDEVEVQRCADKPETRRNQNGPGSERIMARSKIIINGLPNPSLPYASLYTSALDHVCRISTSEYTSSNPSGRLSILASASCTDPGEAGTVSVWRTRIVLSSKQWPESHCVGDRSN